MALIIQRHALIVAALCALIVVSVFTGPFVDDQSEPARDRWATAIDNPYFPLERGTSWTLEGATGKAGVREEIHVTNRTKIIDGIEATIVRDVTYEDGLLHERTDDYYAQDQAGNVWYLGEATVEFEDGEANPAGSWVAGEDGAEAGIIMRAHPQVGDSDWQERYPGEAESLAWTLEVTDNRVRTLEWSPLEPKLVGEKIYARGTGLISERAVTGSGEHVVLTDFSGGGD